MAEIKIKGRREPIVVPNVLAHKARILWRGDPSMNRSPAPRTDIIDLGLWSGELGQIASIEMDHQSKVYEVSEEEVKKIANGLSAFKKSEIRGTLHKATAWPEDLYLESLGVLRFNEYGTIIIKDVAGHDRITRMFKIIRDRKATRNFAVDESLKQIAKGMKI